MALSSGKYVSEVAAGRVFIGSTAAAGTAFPISTGTAVTFGIWNTDPGKYAIPLWFKGGYTSGTIALGSLGFANQNVGYAIGTAAPLSAFNDGTPKNALLGGGNASSMRFCPAGTTTLTAGGTAAMFSGHSIEFATAGNGIFGWNLDFEGSIIIPPGQLFFVCSSIAQTALFSMSIAWAEVPF
nr:hypothetical protein [uncultured archaeon]